MGVKNTLGTCIFSFFAAGVLFIIIVSLFCLTSSGDVFQYQIDCVGADGHRINLTENPNATDVTYAQVINFVENDTTDRMYYNSTFQCADYAEMLQNHAELANITCGFVFITLGHSNIGHACNVFDTTDQGLIFIDCTQSDKRVDLKVGSDYTPVSLRHGNPNYYPMDTVADYQLYW